MFNIKQKNHAHFTCIKNVNINCNGEINKKKNIKANIEDFASIFRTLHSTDIYLSLFLFLMAR